MTRIRRTEEDIRQFQAAENRDTHRCFTEPNPHGWLGPVDAPVPEMDASRERLFEIAEDCP
jgi:hypothetical protein